MNAKLEFLENELNKFIKEYKRSRLVYRNTGFIFRITTVLFSAMITVLLGLRGVEGIANRNANIALILGALITVISAADAFFDFRSLWVRKQVLYRNLQELERDLGFYISGLDEGEIDAEKISEYLKRLNEIVRRDMEGFLRAQGENIPSEMFEINQDEP